MKKTESLEARCGTCAFWNSEGGEDFRERLKSRFRSPYCSLNNQIRHENDMKGCLAWKAAKLDELRQQGIVERELEGICT